MGNVEKMSRAADIEKAGPVLIMVLRDKPNTSRNVAGARYESYHKQNKWHLQFVASLVIICAPVC
jgi:hypothetical protein